MGSRPLTALTIAFAAGIFVASLALWALSILTVLLVLLVGLFAATRRPFWSGAAVLLAFLLLGSARYLTSILRSSNDVVQLAPATVALTGVVESDVSASSQTSRNPRPIAWFTLTAQTAEVGSGASPLIVSGSVQARIALPPQNQDTNVVQNQNQIPRYGDVIQAHGRLEIPSGPRNPGGFDSRAALARKGITATLTARRPEDWHVLQRQNRSPNPFLRLAFALRQRVLNAGRNALPPLYAATLNGILLGERADLPGDLSDAFERTGTTHILATAGLHTGMVVALLLGFLKLLRIARRPALVISLLTLTLYAAMAGGRPSVVRAAIMASVYLVGMLLEREPDIANALSLAVLILLLLNPANLFDAGFQLSFATVITIVLLMPFAEKALHRLRERLSGDQPGRKLVRYMAEIIVACFFLAVAAQIGAAPLVATYFYDVSLVSIVANTLVVPVIALVIACGFSAALLSMPAPLLAVPIYILLNWLLAYILFVVRWCAGLPFAALSISPPPPLLIAVYYAVVWGAAWYRQKEALASIGARA